ASKDLSTAWDQVSNSWRDQKSKQFETKYIAPIPDSISSAVAIIDELDNVLRKIKDNCE
ncbi:MAG: hypothetical protein ACI9MB_004676, partial [Verrucomicrobiales bacterium]